MSEQKKKIAKREIRYCIHIPEREGKNPDLHYVKEQVTYEDGTFEPRAFLVKDFERPVWITKKAFRNHKEKKEFEDLTKVDEYLTTQSNIDRTIARALETPHLLNNRAELLKSPYIYGRDITSTSYIKYLNLKKNNFIQTAYTVAGLDIETSIDTKEIILISIVRKVNNVYEIFMSALSSFYSKADVEEKIKANMAKYIPHVANYTLEVKTSQTEVEVIREAFRRANHWAPDFLAIWNINYDIPYILNRLEQFNVNPIYVLCDESVPVDYRYCRYKRGAQKKVTASGVIKPINPASQWHTLYLTARFYVIDAMCTYKTLRISAPERPSYSLDAILNHELQRGKIKLEEVSMYNGEQWHRVMQNQYKIEYMVYNIYDVIGMLELEEKVKDLSYSLPSGAGITDFDVFNRNPKKIVDAMFVYGQTLGFVPGTVAPKPKQNTEEEVVEASEEEEDDEDSVENNKTLSLKGWIVTLKQNYLLNDGLAIFNDLPNLKTNIRGLVYDSDVSGAYPHATACMNVSKETTLREIIEIEGYEEEVFRQQNLNIVTGEPNSLEYCNVMFKLPKLTDLL